MGLFHCPLGAIFRDDDPCIDCGLCESQTKEEKIQATKKIREHLRSLKKRTAEVKKIAVCGKGGAGKTTFITLLAGVLQEMDYSVIALDTDESNPGLYRMLGLDTEPLPLKSLLKGVGSKENIPSPAWITKDSISTTDIPKPYFSQKGMLRFLSIGKIVDPFEGCACSMADVARIFLDKLTLQEKEILIIDMEAGIESFGRGVERTVDTVLILVEPTFESMALAEKVSYMADGIGVGNVFAVLNKVPSKDIETVIQNKLDDLKIKSIGTIYFSLPVTEAAFKGLPPGESEAKKNVRHIAESLLDLDATSQEQDLFGK
jgi:CO dehydrogenase maturation factor